MEEEGKATGLPQQGNVSRGGGGANKMNGRKGRKGVRRKFRVGGFQVRKGLAERHQQVQEGGINYVVAVVPGERNRCVGSATCRPRKGGIPPEREGGNFMMGEESLRRKDQKKKKE